MVVGPDDINHLLGRFISNYHTIATITILVWFEHASLLQ